MKKTVLVAGGAGYIGSHVTKMMNEAGYQTVVFDNLSKGDRRAVTRGTFIEGDLSDKSKLDQIFKEYHFDAVMHYAAFIDVGESLLEPLKYYQNNVANTLNLLQTMLSHRVNTFIFSSSAAVYGLPQNKQLDENHPCLPINPYGESKLMVEKILKDCHQAYGLKYVSLRYFNAAGGDPSGEVKNYKTKESNLIPIALRSLLTGDTLTIFGTDYPTPDGTCIRDYIHICDLGTAHILAMEHLFSGGSSSIYNLGNGHGFSVKEVLRAIEKVTAKKINKIEGPRRPGDPPWLVANSKKAENELGWKPQYPALETMVQHAWNALNSSPYSISKT